jgi:hydroxymethylpyrimidine pyrophosphatase-like HAD family hydrolase
MGNACDELKSVADYVTESVDEDGIEKALQHFGLI